MVMDGDTNRVDFKSDWAIDTGSQLTESRTALEIVAADNEPLPTILRDPGDIHPAPRLITFDRYIDEAFVDLEVEHIWKRHWQVACRVEDIPHVGDRISYDIVDSSYVVVRTGEHSFGAFHNACRHRGRKLCDVKGSGSKLRCAFHGWSYGLDGGLEWVPYQQDFPGLDTSRQGLVPVRVAEWGGNIFINPDLDAPPLEEALAPMAEHYSNYPQGERYTASKVIVDIECNWKAAQEAFMEGYHVLETHTDGLPIYASVATQIDNWSDGLGLVSRLFTPAAAPDAWVEDRVTARECLEMYCEAFRLPMPPDDRGHDIGDARRYAGDMQRDRVEATTGVDFSRHPTSYFIDQGRYTMFPNFHPFWGEAAPRWHKFKPLGRNPNACQMEIRTLLPIPPSGEYPLEYETYHVPLGGRVFDKFPELGQAAHLVDQDIENLSAVQLGLKAAASGTAYMTLSDYHESMIRRFHEIYDQALGLDLND
jgi:phenylpropionate dioxygenase-like ring-hydroxylating dioxygenase large terminal subunit